MEEIVCNRCSLVCDDVLAEIVDREAKSLGFCRLGYTHLESATHSLGIEAKSRENGNEKNLSLEEALENAAEMLISAKHPLLYGWSHSTNETITEGLALAETLKAVFDSNASMGLCQSMSHEIHNMELETDLEEVLNKGEFILYWGSNPVESSHRHASRFTVFPRGKDVPQGVESRVIGVIDVRETETMKMANHRIIIPHGKDVQLVSALIGDLTSKSELKTPVMGIPTTILIGLSQALKKSDYTVIFYGTGLVNSGKAKENLSAIAELIQTLRGLGKKAYVMPMWHESNDMGIIKSLRKRIDAPASLDFASGKPKAIGNESTLQKMAKGVFDVALIVGNDPLVSIPGNAARGLAGAKLIYIGSAGGITDHRSQISLRTNDDIISGVGTLTRVDMKDIPLKTWGESKQSPQNAFDIVTMLHQSIQKKLRS